VAAPLEEEKAAWLHRKSSLRHLQPLVRSPQLRKRPLQSRVSTRPTASTRFFNFHWDPTECTAGPTHELHTACTSRTCVLNPHSYVPHTNSALPCSNSLFRGYGHLNRL
jgi:hypothetical protein